MNQLLIWVSQNFFFLFGYGGFTIHVIQNLFDYHGIFNAGDDRNAAAALVQALD
jgi:hypothetical protein